MARLIGPDEASREVKAIVGGVFRAKAGRPAQLWADAAATVPADVLNLDGTPIPQQQPADNGGRGVAPTITIDSSSMLPLYQYPPNDVDKIFGTCDGGPAWPIYARTDDRLDALGAQVAAALPLAGGTLTGKLVVNATGAPAGYPIGQVTAAESGLSILSSFAGGEDDGTGTDSTGRLNLYSYQRAQTYSYGEVIRMFAMRGNAKQMQAWYFPAGGYDANLEPVGSYQPVVWTGAHWDANNGLSRHKHWSVETPDSTGAIQTRFEVRFGDPTVGNAIAGLDKTLIATNLADFVVRCTNGQVLRLSTAAGAEKAIEFSNDHEGGQAGLRWKVRQTGEVESGGNTGSNWQLARYDDAGTFVDNPIVVSRSTGNITLGPGIIARRATATVGSLSLNSTSLGGGVGVVAIGNADTPPASNPVNGVVLYVQAGRLKIRQPDGSNQFVALTAT